MARFNGSVSIVTGAASGIGKEIAQRFAAEGATPVIADLDLEAANTAAAENESKGGDAFPVAMDLSVEDRVEKGAADTVAKCSKIDYIPNRPSDPQCISLARERLRRAELRVENLRGLLSELNPSPHELVLIWLKECERVVFNRRFELEALLKERRLATVCRRGFWDI